MVLHSAAVLAYRLEGGDPLVFVGHMGGPFWARKDAGAWSLPKGVYEPGAEDPAAAARREFAEEIGVPWDGPLTLLGEFRQPAGESRHAAHREPGRREARDDEVALGDDEASAAEVGERVGISRATAQRHLAALAARSVVEVRLRYGATGRPEHRYAARR